MNTAEKWNEIYRRYKDGGIDKTDAIIQLREAGVPDWTTADLMLQADHEPTTITKVILSSTYGLTPEFDFMDGERREMPSDDLRDVPDDELPGMWERSDFL